MNLRLLLGLTLTAFVIYAAFFFALQRRILYPGRSASLPVPDPARLPEGLERVWLSTGGGRVEAWFLPANENSADSDGRPGPAAIILHGNAEFIDDWPELVTPLTAAGVSVVLVEYPGFGRSEGSPSQASLVAAAEAGYDWLAGRADIDPDHIFALGRSLGSGVAAILSESRSLAALILWSPFTSVGDLAWERFRLPPFLARDPFDTRRALTTYSGPVLLFHGRYDRTIPPSHSEALAEAAPQAELVLWECGHNDCPPSWMAAWDKVTQFLRSEGLIDQ